MKKTSLFLTLLSTTFIATLWLRAPAAEPVARHTPFTTVLLRDWDRWDTNKDGQLSNSEIDRAVSDPSVTGDDAAVAASLKLISRSKKVVVPVMTRDYFAGYDHDWFLRPHPTSAPATPSAFTDTTASAPGALSKAPINWDSNFIGAKRRIARGVSLPWPKSYSLDHIQQGPLGDCYLLATIGAMIVQHPADIDAMVQATPEGYRFTLPGGKPFVLPPLTQGQLALSSTTVGEGTWIAVIEQGVGRFGEITKGSLDEEGTDTIANGGKITDTMSQLTGHQFRRYHMRSTVAQRLVDAPTLLPKLREEFSSALADHRLITASVHPPIPTTNPTAPITSNASTTLASLPSIPPNITTKHAYTVVSYDPTTDMLEIWNPHGQLFTPKGADGLTNGYTTRHGIFHIPLTEAYSFFSAFVFEVNAPAMQSHH